ncbi:hypothetical protein M992_1248 [Moellerella wisconsensis ATCC 35017]|uniref:Uncharacterized protein n=1 Tax=Moellerella wisconsensis ATCC 35017 TaxID=1354267 RepID=A0A0N0IB72_9GAMM|nr:hypothetical protein M992_1248 [Moellerella wisconsensis ATCC 35017]VFS51234.1 Uncharacterised protein [Moellerella wisconsensis]
MKDILLGGVVYLPGITLVFFFGFFLWLLVRICYVGSVKKLHYAGNVFDISILFTCFLITHLALKFWLST